MPAAAPAAMSDFFPADRFPVPAVRDLRNRLEHGIVGAGWLICSRRPDLALWPLFRHHRIDKEQRKITDKSAICGLAAVTAMPVCYSLDKRSPWFILALAGSCLLPSGDGCATQTM
jgi:hypothetical protein